MMIPATKEFFWKENPALLIALTLLIGSSAPLFWPSPWNFIFPFLWSLYLISLRSWTYLWLIAAAAIYSSSTCKLPETEERVLFSISSLQPHVSPFHKGLVYKGTLSTAHATVPCSVYYKGKVKDHPPANRDYILQGELIKRSPHDYAFKAIDWEGVPRTFSLAEMRYQLKERFKLYLEKHLSSRSAIFLSSLTTGDVEDRLLRYEFSKVGLQHLLAISGFHFAILLTFCSFLCKQIFSTQGAIVFLLLMINAYFLFVGSSPAVQRSWFVAQLYLLAKLLNRNSSPLNLLGCGCILEVLLDPRVSSQIGFQLSFLSTGGILLFYSPIEGALRRFFPKRSYGEISKLAMGEKWVYLLAAILRRSLSLNFAINLSILPLLLYHFHQFPYLSLLYNLFVPTLVGALLFLLCICFLLPFFFPLCDFLTCQILDLVSYLPFPLDHSLKISFVPAWAVPLYLLLLLFCAIRLTKEKEFSYT